MVGLLGGKSQVMDKRRGGGGGSNHGGKKDMKKVVGGKTDHNGLRSGKLEKEVRERLRDQCSWKRRPSEKAYCIKIGGGT